MSIALFNEPVEGEVGSRQVLMLGIEVATPGEHYAFVVNEQGYLTQEPLVKVRTKWRYDKDLQDWVDTGEPEVTEPS